jgi:hypothetical protein
MVKRQPYTNVDRYMEEYRMRTPFATPTPVNRSIPDKRSARSTKQHAAHERSHLRHNPPEAFYHSEGRIDKTPRTKKTHQQQDEIKATHNHHSQEKVLTASAAKKSSCCTIL